MQIASQFVTFGRLRDMTPDALDWANIAGVSPQANADEVISGLESGVSITFRATLSAGSYDAGPKSFLVYVNGSSPASVTAADGATVDATVIDADTVHYEATKGGVAATNWSATITITNVNTGATLDTFTVDVDAP